MPTQILKPTGWFTVKTSQAGNGKVFLNVCTEEAVPRPPPFSDDALRRLTQAEDVKDSKLMDYYLPVILSEVRQETDKSGKPCQVVDCVVHPSVRATSDRISDYRTLLIAMLLDQTDAHFNWNLSREISIPNMKSKGKLKEWTANIPLPETVDSIIPASTIDASFENVSSTPETPIYKQDILTLSNERYLNVTISVPRLTKAAHAISTLDLEPHRLILDIGPLYTLDMVLDLESKGIDVTRATAQWKVKDGSLIVRAPLLVVGDKLAERRSDRSKSEWVSKDT